MSFHPSPNLARIAAVAALIVILLCSGCAVQTAPISSVAPSKTLGTRLPTYTIAPTRTPGPTRTATLTFTPRPITATPLGFELTPSITPIPAEKLTFKQSFALLTRLSGAADLMVTYYEGLDVDADGLAYLFNIYTWSDGQKKACYIQSSTRGGMMTCREAPKAGGPTAAVDTLKDSSELIQEAFAKNPKCTAPMNMAINLTNSQVQLLCSAPQWRVSLSPFK